MSAARRDGKKGSVDVRTRAETVNLLRRLLSDLEEGRVVRVALDLQVLIQELEEAGKKSQTDLCSDPKPEDSWEAVP